VHKAHSLAVAPTANPQIYNKLLEREAAAAQQQLSLPASAPEVLQDSAVTVDGPTLPQPPYEAHSNDVALRASDPEAADDSNKSYSAMSAGLHDPSARSGYESAPAASAAARPSPLAAVAKDSTASSKADAARYLDAGLPSVWHAGSGPRRVLWGTHDVVRGAEAEACTWS